MILCACLISIFRRKPKSSINESLIIDVEVSPIHDSKNGLGPSASSGNGLMLSRTFAKEELCIRWADIHAKPLPIASAILGKGSFGTVISAKWRPTDRVLENGNVETDVAIKVILKSHLSDEDEFERVCKLACEEASLVQNTEERIGNSHHIIKIYGVAEGLLSESLVKMFQFSPDDQVVGIVMRQEIGGSLETLLYKNTDIKLTTADKLRLLVSIAQGLSEIHAVGVVHGDIKPDNILLSPDDPPEARLADFGMARAFASNITGSTLTMTNRMRGTPIYSAPEMLLNPYENVQLIAQASRKTDMYAFALICWAVLTRLRPLTDIKTETMLCSKIHIGHRPNLFRIPADTPSSVLAMINACWDKNRSLRKSAAQCFSILLEAYRQLAPQDVAVSHMANNRHKSHISAKYDVYLMECANRPLAQFLASKLLLRGYHCCVVNNGDVDGEKTSDGTSTEHEIDNLLFVASSSPAIANRATTSRASSSRMIKTKSSKAVVAFIDSTSQKNHKQLLSQLKLLSYSALVVPVIVYIEANSDSWASADLKELSKSSSIIQHDWSAALSEATLPGEAQVNGSMSPDQPESVPPPRSEAKVDSLLPKVEELDSCLRIAGLAAS